ncbi:hypothetical protein EAG14_05400 [Acidovorax sp. 1608163]|nr:hypothetical protein EAG14_05400 [Acidovorax sp. 1608163]
MPQPRSFAREWGPLIAFGIVVLALLVGWRLWTDHMAQAPVEAKYAEYLSALAEHSESARELLERYQKRYERNTIASKHFEAMCAAMTEFAQDDGVDPDSFSQGIADTCRQFIHGTATGEVPDL